MKTILSGVLVAFLWLGLGANAQAQSPVRICFPTAGVNGGAPSCQDVTATNPLPSTATISGLSALSVTVTNTTASPAVVTCTNCATGTSSSSVTIQNVVTGSFGLNAFTDGAISTIGLTTNNSITDSTQTGTLMSFIKGVVSLLSTINASINSPIPNGGNQIGFVTATNIAQATGGWTMLTVTNMLSPPNAIKASAGQLAKLYCYNPNATVAYVQVFNTASGSVTTGTTKPAAFYGIPATNAAGFVMSPTGDQFSTAISMAATTTATGLTAPTTGLDCTVGFN